jgi:ABC-type uncharacterized transport system auxiliary subunit
MRCAAAVAGLALLLPSLLTGCLPPRPHDAERYFVLYPVPAPAQERPRRAVAVVAPASAASFYDTVQIVYSDTPGTRARYRYSFWTEPPPAVLTAQLAARLEGDGAPRFLLRTQLRELFHDAVAAPGAVRLTVVAQLESLPERRLVARHSFTRTVPAATFNAAGAVGATRAALAGVLDDITAWVQAQAGVQAQAAPATVSSAGHGALVLLWRRAPPVTMVSLPTMRRAQCIQERSLLAARKSAPLSGSSTAGVSTSKACRAARAGTGPAPPAAFEEPRQRGAS